MRLALACLTSPKGEVDANLARHLDMLDAHRDCDVVVFPEMSLTGYLTPAAGWDSAITTDDPAVRQLVEATAGGRPAASFGIIEVVDSTRSVAQVVAADGAVVAVQRKQFLGDDEHELFRPAPPGERTVATVAGWRVAVAICAEIHRPEPFATGADVLLCSAAPGLAGRRTDQAGWRAGFDWWRDTAGADLRRRAAERGVWCALATATGATADEDFPGWAALVSPAGEVVAETTDWLEQVLVATSG